MRQIFTRTLTLAIVFNIGFTCTPSFAARFIDLSGNWAERYVDSLSDQGVIAAADDGKFNPGDPITRAQLANWLVKTVAVDSQSVSSPVNLPDVQTTDWFYKPVEIALQNNYMSAYPDGFHPNQYVQKGEVIGTIAKTLNQPTPDEQSVKQTLSIYKDNNLIPDWAQASVAELTKTAILVNNPDQQVVDATSLATRADTAALLYNLYQWRTKNYIAQSTTQAEAQQASSPTSAATNPIPYESPQAMPNANNQANPANNGVPQQGQVQQQGAFSQTQEGNYPQPNYNQQPPMSAYGQAPYGQPNYPPPQNPGYFQGYAATIASGTEFRAALRNSIDSETTQVGEPVACTLAEPLYSGSNIAVPAGSVIQGQVTEVIQAKHFRFGANGKIAIKFTSVQTPDGRQFPLVGSVDTSKLNLSGGTGKGRIGHSLLNTGIGAAGGAALGTGLGAIVGGMSHGSMGMATGMGAVFGTAMGAGVGLVDAGVRKGGNTKIPAGTEVPIKLNAPLQITAAMPPVAQPGYGYGAPQQAPYGNASQQAPYGYEQMPPQSQGSYYPAPPQ